MIRVAQGEADFRIHRDGVPVCGGHVRFQFGADEAGVYDVEAVQVDGNPGHGGDYTEAAARNHGLRPALWDLAQTLVKRAA